jgi:hypothetical protein
LDVSNEWNIPQKHYIDACFNCSDPDHGVSKCPKPIDMKWIDKPKAKFSQSGGGGGGRDKGGGRGHSAGQGHGDGDQTNNCGR